MRSDIRSSASDIITQAEWTGRSNSPALAVGLKLLSWGSTFTGLTPACHWATGRPPPTSALWGFGPESWCQWHQRGCGEVNCAATGDDRSCHSIRSRRDRQAPEHNPPCVVKLLCPSASLCSFVKSNEQWQGGKRTLYQWLEGSASAHGENGNFFGPRSRFSSWKSQTCKRDWNNETCRWRAV